MKLSEQITKNLKEADTSKVFELLDRMLNNALKVKVAEAQEYYAPTSIEVTFTKEADELFDKQYKVSYIYQESPELNVYLYFRLGDVEQGAPSSLPEGKYVLEGYIDSTSHKESDPVSKSYIDVQDKPLINTGMDRFGHRGNSIKANTVAITDVIRETFNAALNDLTFLNDAIQYRTDNNITDSEEAKESDENGYVDIELGFQNDVNSLDELPSEADVRDKYKNIKCSIPKKNVLRIKGPKSILKKIIKSSEFEESKPVIKDLKESTVNEESATIEDLRTIVNSLRTISEKLDASDYPDTYDFNNAINGLSAEVERIEDYYDII